MSRSVYNLIVCLLLLLPLLVIGCISFPVSTTSPDETATDTSQDATTDTPSTAPATTTTNTVTVVPVIQAWLEPAGITPKGTAELHWNVVNASSVVVDHGIGSVPASGKRAVSPDVTTTYTITAYHPGGTVTNSVTLPVAPAATPVYEKNWVGSKHTMEYHYPVCSIARKIPLPSKIWFDTVAEARAAGFRPCVVCHPPR